MEIIPIKIHVNRPLVECDERLLQIEGLIDAKRRMLLDKQKKLKMIFKQNHFLDAVKNDYVNYYNYISQQKQVESKLKYIGEHDSLTGLITRPLMNDRIQQGILWSDRHKNMMAICFLDIDDFKQVNDTYGHIIGDQLLIEISKRLKRCLRKTDSIARVGGDEFIFILLEINSEDAAINVIKKIFQCFKIPFQIDDLSITVTYSIGVSLYPKDGKKSLIEKSDSAMYYVKKNGKNNFKIFDKLHC